MADPIFEPRPCIFQKLNIVWRWTNDIIVTFWFTDWFQIYKKWPSPGSPGTLRSSWVNLVMTKSLGASRWTHHAQIRYNWSRAEWLLYTNWFLFGQMCVPYLRNFVIREHQLLAHVRYVSYQRSFYEWLNEHYHTS